MIHISRNSGIILNSEDHFNLVQIIDKPNHVQMWPELFPCIFVSLYIVYCRYGVDPMTRPHQLWSPQIQDGQQTTDVTV